LQETRHSGARNQDDRLILGKPRCSLIKRPSEGVLGALDCPILDQRPRTGPVGELVHGCGRALTGGLGQSAARGLGRAGQSGPALGVQATDEWDPRAGARVNRYLMIWAAGSGMGG
jgi:hypothetical protein